MAETYGRQLLPEGIVDARVDVPQLPLDIVIEGILVVAQDEGFARLAVPGHDERCWYSGRGPPYSCSRTAVISERGPLLATVSRSRFSSDWARLHGSALAGTRRRGGGTHSASWAVFEDVAIGCGRAV